MAHESFEDPEVARLLNEGFVAIKVDREERPDIDQMYMRRHRRPDRSGGWPMSVFLTAGPRVPLYAGHLLSRPGSTVSQPGFGEMPRPFSSAWLEQREELMQSASRRLVAS